MTGLNEGDKSEKLLRQLAEKASEWTDQEFATRIVDLLIEDKSLINAWQQTIEMMIRIAWYRNEIFQKKVTS